MIKRMAALLLSAALLTVSAGCNYQELVQKSDADYGSRKANDPKMIRGKTFGSLSTNPNQHHNTFFEYSSAISKRVSNINGISSANVMLTDKNAYVAIMLDWTAVGTTNSGGTEEQNNTPTTKGLRNSDTGNPYREDGSLASPSQSYFTVNDINNLSDELKNTIALKVRELAPNVQEVHISANMELVNYFNEFAMEAWGGRALMPWIDDFNTVVQYHFAGGKVMPTPINQLKSKRPIDASSTP